MSHIEGGNKHPIIRVLTEAKGVNPFHGRGAKTRVGVEPVSQVEFVEAPVIAVPDTELLPIPDTQLHPNGSGHESFVSGTLLGAVVLAEEKIVFNGDRPRTGPSESILSFEKIEDFREKALRISMVNANVYFKGLKIIDGVVKNHYTVGKLAEAARNGEDKKKVTERAIAVQTAVEDLWLADISKDTDLYQQLRSDLGEEEYLVSNLASIATGKIEQLRVKMQRESAGWSPKKQADIFVEMGQSFAALSKAQKERLFAQGQYSEEKTAEILKRVGLSIGASAALNGASEAISGVTALYTFTHEAPQHYSDPATLLKVIGSYALFYFATGLNAYVNTLMLKKFKWSTSAVQTLAGNMSENQWAIFLAGLVGQGVKEFAYAGALVKPELAENLNIAGAGFISLIGLAGATSLLAAKARGGQLEKNESEKKQSAGEQIPEVPIDE